MSTEEPYTPSGMLIETKGGIRYHNTTGRELNFLKDAEQAPTSEIFSEEFEAKLLAFDIAGAVVKGYKLEFPRTYKGTIDKLSRLVIWMVFDPHKFLIVRSKALGITVKTTNRIVSHLEGRGYALVLQGYGVINGGGKPMVIKATDTLLNIRN